MEALSNKNKDSKEVLCAFAKAIGGNTKHEYGLKKHLIKEAIKLQPLLKQALKIFAPDQISSFLKDSYSHASEFIERFLKLTVLLDTKGNPIKDNKGEFIDNPNLITLYKDKTLYKGKTAFQKIKSLGNAKTAYEDRKELIADL